MMLLFSVSFSSLAEDELAKTLTVGLFDEYYPTHDVAPHARGISVQYKSDAITNRDWTNLRSYYVAYDVKVNLEEDGELYDSDRYPFSLDMSVDALIPVFNHGKTFAASVIGGIDIDENGPQVNDKHYMAHGGLQAEQILSSSDFGRFSIKGSVEYVNYYYEIDDEVGTLQTGTTRSKLAHGGGGTYAKLELQYNKGSNEVRFLVSQIDASDTVQDMGDYSRDIQSFEYVRQVNKKTRCGIGFSVTTHEYQPEALYHEDELYRSNAGCQYKF